MKPATGFGVLALGVLYAVIAVASAEDPESYYRYYYKEKIHMIVDTESVAVHDATQGPPEGLARLLGDAGYPGSELRSFPVPGWTIALLRSASSPPIPGTDVTPFPSPEKDGRPGNDCDVHGTPVAGVISGISDNQLGTTGVAPDVKIASARAHVSGLSCSGSVGSEAEWIVAALQWAEDIGASMTNNSYYLADSAISSCLTEKFQDTYDKGIVHFAGAGNVSTDPVAYPAYLPSVNAVSSIAWNGSLSTFSSSGPQIAFTAPGTQIRTTDRQGALGWDPSDYVIADGTSFATAMASGVAALILSVSPGLTPPDLEEIMSSTAVDLGDPGRDDLFGWGLVNARNALDLIVVFSDGFETGDTSQWSATVN